MNSVAIVSAYNEAPRVSRVIRPLLASGRFTRVIVVDDGSTDGTADIARSDGAVVIRIEPNGGKGNAMRIGFASTTEECVCFFDSDLVGLHPDHVHALLDPVTRGSAAMCVGLQDYGVYSQLQTALPLISGQRAVLRSVLLDVPDALWDGFSIEAGINGAAERAALPTVCTVMHGVTQVPKWQKVGVPKGISDGVKMMMRVLVATRNASRP